MRTVVLIMALVLLALSPAVAQTSSPAPSASAAADLGRSRIDAMLSSGKADAAWFSASFLSQYPIDQINALLGRLKAGLGDYQGIDGAQGHYVARFAKGTDEVLIHLDADNKIDGLLFKPAKLTL